MHLEDNRLSSGLGSVETSAGFAAIQSWARPRCRSNSRHGTQDPRNIFRRELPRGTVRRQVRRKRIPNRRSSSGLLASKSLNVGARNETACDRTTRQTAVACGAYSIARGAARPPREIAVDLLLSPESAAGP